MISLFFPEFFFSGYADRTDFVCWEGWAGKWADDEEFFNFLIQEFVEYIGLGDCLLQIVACVGGIWHDLQTWVEAMGKTLDEEVNKLVVWMVL